MLFFDKKYLNKLIIYFLIFIIITVIVFFIKVIKTGASYRKLEKEILSDIEFVENLNNLNTGDLIITYKNGFLRKQIVGFGFNHNAIILHNEFDNIYYIYDVTLKGARFEKLDIFLSRCKQHDIQVFIKKFFVKDLVKDYYKKQILRWTNIRYYKSMYYAYHTIFYFIPKYLKFDENERYNEQLKNKTYYNSYKLNNKVWCKNYKKKFENTHVNKIAINKKKINSNRLNCAINVLEIYHNSNIINLDILKEYLSWHPVDFLINVHTPWSNKNLIIFDPKLYKLILK